MLMVQMLASGPVNSSGCETEVATSPFCKKRRTTKQPVSSPLLRGEQTSCTCASNTSEQLASGAADLAPEVTQSPPLWVEGLFTSELFGTCPCHTNLRKNECNFYCLSCTPASGRGMCKYCLADHTKCGGTVFQIRKYMYQTCVHVEDLQRSACDTSGVQAYCINGKRAVLIHPKASPPGQLCPAFDNTCRGCNKPLRSDCQFCSLRCKVDVQFGRAPRTPEVMPLEPQQTRAPMTIESAPSDSAGGSARSSSSQWTCTGRSKKRKCDHPARSFLA